MFSFSIRLSQCYILYGKDNIGMLAFFRHRPCHAIPDTCFLSSFFSPQGLTRPADLFVVIEVDSYGHYFRKSKTQQIQNSMEPLWDEEFIIELEGSENLRILVYEQSAAGKKVEMKENKTTTIDSNIFFSFRHCPQRTRHFGAVPFLADESNERAADQHERRRAHMFHEVCDL